MTNLYVLVRETDGKYVAKPGQPHSYTYDLRYAATYTQAEVQRHRCGNELAVRLDSLLNI